MHGIEQFGHQLLLWGTVGVAALVGHRLARFLRVPASVLVLVLAAAAGGVVGRPSLGTVVDVVTVALIVILFDGGMHLGKRFRTAIGPIIGLGTVGTFLTAGLVALGAHFLFGIEVKTALVLGAALAPTDPAVVFSVLANRELTGKTSAILEGESGVNDPAGIALLVGFASFATATDTSMAGIVVDFLRQMAVGAAVGLVGGAMLAWLLARVKPLASEHRPVGVLAIVLALYGIAAAAHGSGFLAALLAGIVVAHSDTQPTHDVRRFTTTLATMGEITAFVLLGLSFDFSELTRRHIWLTGIGIALLLVFVVRPAVVLPMLAPTRLGRGEKVFVAWAGLKGAVPILLGALAVQSGVPDAGRIYAIVFIVVALSVAGQGGSLGAVAHRLRVTTRAVSAG